MAINFPLGPTPGQTYTFGNYTWTWNGTVWNLAPMSYSGYSGYSGATGTGTSGYSGFSGATGTSGYSGFSGGTGTSGYSGFSGATGTSGYSGVQKVFVQTTAPVSPPASYLWIQTGLGAGHDVTFWYEDGLGP